MKAIVVTDQAAGTAGMKLAERPEPPAAINDVIVQIHASGFVPTEMAWHDHVDMWMVGLGASTNSWCAPRDPPATS